MSAKFDEVPDVVVSTAEVTSQSELERQEEQALADMLRNKAAKERREQAAYVKAGLVTGGAIFTPAELAARCSAALSLAAKGYRVHLSDPEWSELRSAVLAAAVKVATGESRMIGPVKVWNSPDRRSSRIGHDGQRHLISPAERLFHAPYGTPAAERRCRLLESDALYADSNGWLPRSDRATLAYLVGAARNLIGDLLSARDRTGALPPAEESTAVAVYGSRLSGNALADHIGATERERLALLCAMDGVSPTEWAAEKLRTPQSGQDTASRGRKLLRARWETPTAAIAAIAAALADPPADPTEPNLLPLIGSKVGLWVAPERLATLLDTTASERRNSENTGERGRAHHVVTRADWPTLSRSGMLSMALSRRYWRTRPVQVTTATNPVRPGQGFTTASYADLSGAAVVREAFRQADALARLIGQWEASDSPGRAFMLPLLREAYGRASSGHKLNPAPTASPALRF